MGVQRLQSTAKKMDKKVADCYLDWGLLTYNFEFRIFQ